MKNTTTELERQARQQPICMGCGGEKNSGEHACIVCWECWRHPILPFKYYNGTLDTWLKEYEKHYKKEQ